MTMARHMAEPQHKGGKSGLETLGEYLQLQPTETLRLSQLVFWDTVIYCDDSGELRRLDCNVTEKLS